jgi:CRP-like cAMP-binding protein
MISPEIIRRYPFFAGLSLDQIDTLAKAASEEKVEAGHFFLREGDEVPYLYLVVEGTANAPALVPPHKATASVKAAAPCHLIALDCRKLLEAFEEDYQLGYVMMTKAAQLTRDRIANMNIEFLAYLAEETGGK